MDLDAQKLRLMQNYERQCTAILEKYSPGIADRYRLLMNYVSNYITLTKVVIITKLNSN